MLSITRRGALFRSGASYSAAGLLIPQRRFLFRSGASYSAAALLIPQRRSYYAAAPDVNQMLKG